MNKTPAIALENHDPERGGRAIVVAIALALASLTSGCKPSVSPQGKDHSVLASYSMRTLSASLPSNIPVLAVQAAAESALRSRGYFVTKSVGTADSARITAKKAGDGDFDKVVVTSSVGKNSTDVDVTCEPFGDEAASRAIMDAVLNRLKQ